MTTSLYKFKAFISNTTISEPIGTLKHFALTARRLHGMRMPYVFQSYEIYSSFGEVDVDDDDVMAKLLRDTKFDSHVQTDVG
jgi:hypothetical protein